MTPSCRAARALLLLPAIALGAASAHAAEYSGTVFFGDSLTDSGHFRDQLPVEARPVTGKFTTNPGLVWAEALADRLGTRADPDVNGGSNYAQGGSRAAVANGASESTLTQIQHYLQDTGGRADPNALYTVWSGANDIFAIASGEPAQQTLVDAATGTVVAVGQLRGAGARYVLVPSLPDMGITPDAIAAGATAQAQLTQLSQTYNVAVYGALTTAGYQVIPLDTFHLLREVSADPVAYGLVNVTDPACGSGSSLICNPTSFVTPDAADTYLFADGVHPSRVTHGMLAEYAVSVLEGPRLNQVLGRSARVIGRSRADRVANHLSARPDAGWRWWGSVRSDYQRYAHADLYDGWAPAGLFGIDWAQGDWVFGGFAGYGRVKADFGRRQGDYRQKDTTLGLFAGWYGDGLWVNGQVGYSWLSYDVHREVRLGVNTRRHDGSPDGRNLSAGLSAGYEFDQGALWHGPVASLLWQKIKVDGYAERGYSSTALSYGGQDNDSLLASVGWQASYAINDKVRPYARLTWDHEFKDPSKQAFATLQTVAEAGRYAVPGLGQDDNYGTMVLGARAQLFGLDTDMGVRSTFEQRGGRDFGVFVDFARGF